MEFGRILLITAGYAVPLVIAPLLCWGLRPLFAIFFSEGAELIADLELPGHYTRDVGRIMAKSNVIVLLATWMVFFTLLWLHMDRWMLLTAALLGMAASLWIVTLAVRANAAVAGGKLIIVGAICFTGGNLPIIVVGATVLAFR